jgi:hypothetical protein
MKRILYVRIYRYPLIWTPRSKGSNTFFVIVNHEILSWSSRKDRLYFLNPKQEIIFFITSFHLVLYICSKNTTGSLLIYTCSSFLCKGLVNRTKTANQFFALLVLEFLLVIKGFSKQQDDFETLEYR